MRLFQDTNVLLDVAMKRAGLVEGSSAVVSLCGSEPHECWIAWHTLSNIFYILHRHLKSATRSRQFVNELLAWVQVPAVDQGDACRARDLPMQDLEDAMKVAAAEACRADVIITRNVTDFTGSPIPACTPEDFLARNSGSTSFSYVLGGLSLANSGSSHVPDPHGQQAEHEREHRI